MSTVNISMYVLDNPDYAPQFETDSEGVVQEVPPPGWDAQFHQHNDDGEFASSSEDDDYTINDPPG